MRSCSSRGRSQNHNEHTSSPQKAKNNCTKKIEPNRFCTPDTPLFKPLNTKPQNKPTPSATAADQKARKDPRVASTALRLQSSSTCMGQQAVRMWSAPSFRRAPQPQPHRARRGGTPIGTTSAAPGGVELSAAGSASADFTLAAVGLDAADLALAAAGVVGSEPAHAFNGSADRPITVCCTGEISAKHFAWSPTTTTGFSCTLLLTRPPSSAIWLWNNRISSGRG
mmetsp:Transcript_95576/g.292300  ORF Transcript_95576/g.292300 Transcript_95576/m.292300 type:complete len:225 (+) Transcript_95576:889-1563(+)